ncbi:MAG: ATP-binding protein [Chloroflexi bacterium]|nr:ATP-binding protein [Chloroflexota bacterium]
MEPIGEILKRVRANSANRDRDKSSGAEPLVVNHRGEPEETSLESDCPVCKGGKFVHPLLPSGKPDYSKVVPCRCAFQADGIDRTPSWAPQFNKQKEMTFEKFDWQRVPLEQRENLERAFQLAFEFANSPEGWLVFRGDNGCGKTHLAAAIVNHRYQMKEPAVFIVVPDFLDHLKSTFSPGSETSYDQLFESVKNSPLLVLDDFGKQTTTPWAQEKLFQVINYRYNAKLPTVITTNLEEEEMDNSILARFADPTVSTPFHITAPAYFSGRHSSRKPPRGGQRGW